jgi:hypothetical protein
MRSTAMQLAGVLVSNLDQCASWRDPILGSRPSAFGMVPVARGAQQMYRYIVIALGVARDLSDVRASCRRAARSIQQCGAKSRAALGHRCGKLAVATLEEGAGGGAHDRWAAKMEPAKGVSGRCPRGAVDVTGGQRALQYQPWPRETVNEKYMV